MKVLVTGGSSGIGYALVELLLERKYQVTFTYNSNQQAAEELKNKGADSISYQMNDSESLVALLQEIKTGNYQGLVNNAGQLHEQSLFTEIGPDKFMDFVNTGLNDFVKITHTFASSLQNNDLKGSIVNVLSSYTLGMPPARISAYTTLKYSMLGVTRALASELIQYGIRVNAVSPSMTRTNLLSDLPERFLELAEAGFPMKRLAEAKESATAIAFLLGDESSYINGVNLPVTGGITC